MQPKPLAPGQTIAPYLLENLKQDLENLPFLLNQLELTLTKQTRYTLPQNTHNQTKNLLPYNLQAAKNLETLHALLTRLTKQNHTQTNTKDDLTHQTLKAARYLHANLNALQGKPQAPHIYQALHTTIKNIYHTIDRPQDYQLIGTCPHCAHLTYAPKHAPEITCKCGQIINTHQARLKLIEKLNLTHLTPAKAAKLLTVFYPATPRQIYAKLSKAITHKTLTISQGKIQLGAALKLLQDTPKNKPGKTK